MDDTDVLSIVCSNNAELLKLLDSVTRNPSLAKRSVGDSVAELKALVQSESPDIAILDVDLPDGSGYQLCRDIKVDDSLANTQVILVHRAPLDESSARETSNCGANDSILLPIHSDDLDCHISQCSSLYSRSSTRVAADMRVVLEREGSKTTGSVLNLTTNGLGLQTEAPIELGPVHATLIYENEKYPNLEGKVIWSRDDAGGAGWTVGLNLGTLTPEARSLLVKLSLFQVSPNESGEGITVSLQGGFDERTDFAPLLEKVGGAKHVDFMMQGVTYLSSCGVRSWCLFVEALDADVAYSFRNCSLAFASQASMVPMAIGAGDVVSMQAPYFCDTCDREETRLIESRLIKRAGGDLKPPPMHCQTCKKALVFDDIPGRYFAFLGD